MYLAASGTESWTSRHSMKEGRREGGRAERGGETLLRYTSVGN